MQVVSEAIQPSIRAVHLCFSDGRCLSEFSLDYPSGGWQRITESGLRVRHQESFPPPQRTDSVWQCTCHLCSGNSLCWREGRCIVESRSSIVCAIYMQRLSKKSTKKVCSILCSGSVLLASNPVLSQLIFW